MKKYETPSIWSVLLSQCRKDSNLLSFENILAMQERTNLLQVVNVIDNPMLIEREPASDGVMALRADRERQRRHSACQGTSKVFTNNFR